MNFFSKILQKFGRGQREYLDGEDLSDDEDSSNSSSKLEQLFAQYKFLIIALSLWGVFIIIILTMVISMMANRDEILRTYFEMRNVRTISIASLQFQKEEQDAGAISAESVMTDALTSQLTTSSIPGAGMTEFEIIPTENTAFSQLLLPHPDPALIETSNFGILPTISTDGRLPWRTYARPFEVLETRPIISIIVTDAGYNRNTFNILLRLPGAVSFSFSPYSDDIQDLVRQSRDSGHEVFLNVPMEPRDFPFNDPGPLTLLTRNTPEQNEKLLLRTLGVVTGYVGLVNDQGELFLSDLKHMRSFLSVMKERGIVFLDTHENVLSKTVELGNSLNTPVLVSDLHIKEVIEKDKLDEKLIELENIAHNNGYATLVVKPFPRLLQYINIWSSTLEDKGIVLQPVSAIYSKKQ